MITRYSSFFGDHFRSHAGEHDPDVIMYKVTSQSQLHPLELWWLTVIIRYFSMSLIKHFWLHVLSGYRYHTIPLPLMIVDGASIHLLSERMSLKPLFQMMGSTTTLNCFSLLDFGLPTTVEQSWNGLKWHVFADVPGCLELWNTHRIPSKTHRIPWKWSLYLREYTIKIHQMWVNIPYVTWILWAIVRSCNYNTIAHYNALYT